MVCVGRAFCTWPSAPLSCGGALKLKLGCIALLGIGIAVTLVACRAGVARRGVIIHIDFYDLDISCGGLGLALLLLLRLCTLLVGAEAGTHVPFGCFQLLLWLRRDMLGLQKIAGTGGVGTFACNKPVHGQVGRKEGELGRAPGKGCRW